MGNSHSYSDDELFGGFCKGIQAIVQWIYDHLRPRIIQWICRNSGSTEEGEDIFQETLIVLLDICSRRDFKLTGSFSGLLMGISKNKWQSNLRRKKRLGNVRLDDIEEYTGNKDTIDEMMANHERMDILRKAMDLLPSGCKELITLIDIEDVPVLEVVTMKGWSGDNYLYRRKSECKAKLKAILCSKPEWRNQFPYIFKDEIP